MIELEILFSNGQGIIVPLEDRETALRFMKQAMDAKQDASLGLFHLSTTYDEMLFDLREICFIRLKKENVPLIGATLKLPAISATRLQAEAAAHDGVQTEPSPEAPVQDKTEESSGPENGPSASDSEKSPPKSETKSQAKTESKADPLQAEYDVLQSQIQKAEQQFHKAEERLSKIEEQRKRVEAQLKQQREAMEDAAREAKLKSSIEAIEIDKEISRMKEQNPS